MRNSTYGRLARAILQFSLEQGLGSGDRIPPVRKLSMIFGVSRPTIRRALTALEATGNLQTLPGIGSFLIDPSASLHFAPCPESSPLLILQACVTIEPAIAAEAARKRTTGILARMRRQRNELQSKRWHLNVRGSMHSNDIRFHELLASASGKQTVIIVGGLWRSFYAKPNQNAFRVLSMDESRRAMLNDYDELIDAIGSQDELHAKRAMRNHLIALQELIRHGPVEEVAEADMQEPLRDVA
jgi:DNA-binding FadR family transcriptional regulator